MKTVPLTRRDLRQLRRFIARPPKPTQALIDIMNTPRQPTVEETLRAEIAALKAKLARVSAAVSYREYHEAERACPYPDDHGADACQYIIASRLREPPARAAHVVTPETPDETTARMKADMDRRLTDPAVRASVCRLPKGYKLPARVADAVDWATRMIEKTGVDSAADDYWLDSSPGKPPHSAPPTQSQEVRMVDPMIPGLDAAVEAAVNELRLTYNEGPGDLYDLVHDALTAAYPHLIEPAIKAAGQAMRERCAEVAGWHKGGETVAASIRALPLTDPTEPPETV